MTMSRPMDQVALRNADLLILTALTQTPTANPDSMLGEFCMAVGEFLRWRNPVSVTTLTFHLNFVSVDTEGWRQRFGAVSPFWIALRLVRMLVGSFRQHWPQSDPLFLLFTRCGDVARILEHICRVVRCRFVLF